MVLQHHFHHNHNPSYPQNIRSPFWLVKLPFFCVHYSPIWLVPNLVCKIPKCPSCWLIKTQQKPNLAKRKSVKSSFYSSSHHLRRVTFQSFPKLPGPSNNHKESPKFGWLMLSLYISPTFSPSHQERQQLRRQLWSSLVAQETQRSTELVERWTSGAVPRRDG